MKQAIVKISYDLKHKYSQNIWPTMYANGTVRLQCFEQKDEDCLFEMADAIKGENNDKLVLMSISKTVNCKGLPEMTLNFNLK